MSARAGLPAAALLLIAVGIGAGAACASTSASTPSPYRVSVEHGHYRVLDPAGRAVTRWLVARPTASPSVEPGGAVDIRGLRTRCSVTAPDGRTVDHAAVGVGFGRERCEVPR